MDYETPIVERINNSFLTQNPYAKSAVNTRGTEQDYREGDNPIFYAMMAIAYELSQIKYHLSRGNKHGRQTRSD